MLSSFYLGQSRRLILQRLLEDGAEVRPGYTLEYCALTSVDLNGSFWGDLAGNFASRCQRLGSDDIGEIDA
jgi:hypothetical protein